RRVLDFFEIAVAPWPHDQLLIASSGTASVSLESGEVVDIPLQKDVVPPAVVVDRDLNITPMKSHLVRIKEMVLDVVLQRLADPRFSILALKPHFVELFPEHASHECRLCVDARPRDHRKHGDKVRRHRRSCKISSYTHRRGAEHPDFAIRPRLFGGPFDRVE